MLTRISESFTVSDIMVPQEMLIRASHRTEAENYFDLYDVIPAPSNGAITGYFDREKTRRQTIGPPLLVSDKTPLLEVPELLRVHRYFFVLKANQVVGYVHYSDLNNPIVKLPIFVLVESLEASLWDLVNKKTSGCRSRTDLKSCS